MYDLGHISVYAAELHLSIIYFISLVTTWITTVKALWGLPGISIGICFLHFMSLPYVSRSWFLNLFHVPVYMIEETQSRILIISKIISPKVTHLHNHFHFDIEAKHGITFFFIAKSWFSSLNTQQTFPSLCYQDISLSSIPFEENFIFVYIYSSHL